METITGRIKKDKDLEKWEKIKEYVDNNSDKYSNQASIIFCIRNTYSDIKDLEASLE